jgi:hypothetical protein
MSDKIREIDITPDPQVLYVLTYTSMRPIDSLCELIDNAIDSFRDVTELSKSLILIDLPRKKEVSTGDAVLRVRDNGPGLSIDQVENSLKAGYSSKYRFGNLGLFGVGFNIASGKLGMVTKFITAREQDSYAIETVIDLQELRKQGHYKITPEQIPKPDYLKHGTVVEVSKPWQEGNQNYGFMQKLVQQSRPTIMRMLGRKYATILRKKTVRIQLNDDTIEPFEHCSWSAERFVERQKHGKIFARDDFDNVIHKQRRCGECGSLVASESDQCVQPGCGSSTIRAVEEKIRGWVGIQRYLDPSHFGIDLIRNGRAIRPLEKQAFFEFTDENGDTILDYPIDDRAGRIIGEIHLDHVPVDPAKQDFERTSPEWHRAIAFLRGLSSLQPSQPGATENDSPVYRLYQGFRKVRTPGKHDLYMGKWQPGSDKPSLLSGSEVQDLRTKFEDKDPGYFTDEEWWKLVQLADHKPVKGLKKCPECMIESPEETEECPACSYLFASKICINKECSKDIPKKSGSCPHCGANQIPTVEEPWKCAVCNSESPENLETCKVCGNQRGTENPLDDSVLEAVSKRVDRLCVSSLTVTLASGDESEPVAVEVFSTEEQVSSCNEFGEKFSLPLIRFTFGGQIKIYIDLSHQLFSDLRTTPEHAVSYEIAQYLFALNQGLASKYQGVHSLTNLAQAVLERNWKSNLSTTEQSLGARIDELYSSIKERLSGSVKDESEDVYSSMSEKDTETLVVEIINSRRDPADLKAMIASGEFLNFLSPDAILLALREFPHLFFDGKVWEETYEGLEVPSPTAKRIQDGIKARYLNHFEALILFQAKGGHQKQEALFADSACSLLVDRLN